MGQPRGTRRWPAQAADAARYRRSQETRAGTAPADPIQPRAPRTEDRSPAPSPTAPQPRHPRRQATASARADPETTSTLSASAMGGVESGTGSLVTGFQDFLQLAEVLRHGSLDSWRRQ